MAFELRGCDPGESRIRKSPIQTLGATLDEIDIWYLGSPNKFQQPAIIRANLVHRMTVVGQSETAADAKECLTNKSQLQVWK